MARSGLSWVPIFRPPYSKQGGLGVAFELLRANELNNNNTPSGLKVGIVGLGVGTTAAWAEPQDAFVFYELDPKVLHVAETYFSFLESSLSKPANQIVIGDARVQLEKQLEQGHHHTYDLLAIDAFSSDSIPMHLLTKECTEVYLNHLNSDGILAFHISNRFVNLVPLTRNLASELKVDGFLFDNTKRHQGSSPSTWVLMTTNERLAGALETHDQRDDWPTDEIDVVWTDDFGAMVPLINWEDLLDWVQFWK